MWGAALVLLSCVALQGTSQDIKMECRENHEFPPISSHPPSALADLKVMLVTVGGTDMLNISWAVNIDDSIKSLKGTRLVISGEEMRHCEYNPSLVDADLHMLEQKWFYYLIKASTGIYSISGANYPFPPLVSEFTYKLTSITVPHPKSDDIPKTTQVPIVEVTPLDLRKDDYDNINFTSIAVAIFGGLAGLMILTSCYIIYKSCGANFATSLGFQKLPTSSMVPIPVLVVYPAENLAFQRAVVALAEFLQCHGSCTVAIDMWQQGKIAELGPMRWLSEQTKAANRVLIVCPQIEIPSSQPSHSPPNHSFPGPSIPAAAHDLYPLILNMVAGHAKSPSDLAKFWVVQLGEPQDKRPHDLALELRACQSFCLMKDLNKLCRSLHAHRQDNKMSNLIFRPGIAYNEKSAAQLREAVKKLEGHQQSIFREVEPLKSVVTTI